MSAKRGSSVLLLFSLVVFVPWAPERYRRTSCKGEGGMLGGWAKHEGSFRPRARGDGEEKRTR